ncbi:hypothetical protein [Bowmanella sp. JS7-9]|uniref:Uncharacterized protein n=1 Tax=Pseudobowmanella zhangzhouensis TaxID=1537679 RepID=A0ABW1XHB6_9ALTE|nr:hypothetical protein [Bowmanella sp. JS7-9]
MSEQKTQKSRLTRWWHTECERCKRLRAMFIWTVLMLVLVLTVWF